MLLDDRPSHPMVSFLEVHFQGTLDLDCLTMSGERVLERHPLLHACLVGKKLADWHWVQAPHPLRIQSIGSVAELPQSGGEAMNLRDSSGLKAWVLVNGESSTIYLQVHHAVSDALGMLTFLMEWLALYAQLIHGGTDITHLSPPTPGRLKLREDYRRLKSPYPYRDRWSRIAKVLLGKKTAVLKPSAGCHEVNLPTPQHCRVIVPADQIARIKALAEQEGVTLGDTVLAALFQTLKDWNGPQEQGAFRVVVPVNRREDSEPFLSATNKISYKYISREGQELTDRRTALRSISEEMQLVRRNRRSIFSFLKVLKSLEKTGLLKRILDRQKPYGTVVFSNLGDLNQLFSPLLPERDGKFVAGNLVLESLSCAPPRRPFTHTTVACFSYAGNLILCSRGDGRGLNATDTQLFLDALRVQLQQ